MGLILYKFRPFQFQLPFIAIHTNLYAHAVIFTKFEFDIVLMSLCGIFNSVYILLKLAELKFFH